MLLCTDHPCFRRLWHLNHLVKFTIYSIVDFPVLTVALFFVQPENPAEFGGRVYEMMGLALAGRRSSRGEQKISEDEEDTKMTEDDSLNSSPDSEIVEPSEVITENDPWKS